MCIGIIEIDKKKRDTIFPRNSPKARQVWNGDHISISVLFIADSQLLEVGLIVHIPPKDNGAETEAILRDREKLLLGDKLSA